MSEFDRRAEGVSELVRVGSPKNELVEVELG